MSILSLIRFPSGLIHITDWMPTLASLAGVPSQRIDELAMDGIDQRQMLMEGGASKRTEFVYNIKTSPFKAGYRMGDFKLLWGEQPKGDWFTLEQDSTRARKLRNKIDWEGIQMKLTSENNKVDLDEDDWDLEEKKSLPAENPDEDFESLSVGAEVRLYNVRTDPEERIDLAESQPDVVEVMKQKILEQARTMRRANFRQRSVLGHPFLHGGNFMPGWCVAE